MNAPFNFVPHAEPFFFDVDPGTRYCLYHPPSSQVPPRGAILYVHPFAEELNLSRRMAAQQARAFAALGFAVLQIDLFGCGDSCGDFAAGRWEQWQRDLAVAAAWLRRRQSGPLYVWGLRLGALLAMDLAASSDVAGLILWQPLISGRTAIKQFIRQQASKQRADRSGEGAPRLAAAIDVRGGGGSGDAIRALRAQLDARGRITVGGFELELAMVRSIEAREAIDLPLRAHTVHWFSSAAMPRRLAARWQTQGLNLHHYQLPLQRFWADAERAECPALLAATCAALADDPATLADAPPLVRQAPEDDASAL